MIKTLEWNGYIKEPKWENRGYKLGGEPLSDLAEEMLYKLASFYTDDKENMNMRQKYLYDKQSMKNAYSDIKYELTSNQKKIPFLNDEYWNLLKEMHNQIEIEKEQKSEFKKTHKELIKRESEMRKLEYGFATVNGESVAINPQIELSGWFVGRGDNAVNMHWKYRVEDKDIEINWISDKKCPFDNGHIVSKSDIDSCATYKVRIGHNNEMSVIKTIRFSKCGEIGQNEEIHKFDVAKEVIENWTKIEKYIEKAIKSDNKVTKQNGLISYLVFNLGIRIGGDSGARQNNVMGASTLTVDTISFNGNEITLDFIGKDSVKDCRVFKVKDWLLEEFKNCTIGKKPKDKLFESSNASSVREFLDGFGIEDLSPKKARTAFASSILAEEFRKMDWENLTDKQFKFQCDKAQLECAKKLNHHTTKSSKQLKEIESKNKEKIKDAKTKLESKKKVLGDKITELELKIENTDDKTKIKEYKSKIKEIKDKQTKLIQEFVDLKESLNFKTSLGDISLSTSKVNYCDPRLYASVCVKANKDLSKLFTKSALEKINWAKSVDGEFYMNYPCINNY